MLKILDQKSSKKKTIILNSSQDPIFIEHIPHRFSNIYMDSGVVNPATCISCITPKCMLYTNEELQNEAYPDFPMNINRFVCPTGALTWARGEFFPSVRNAMCINCGICALRCPIGAIFLTDNGAQISVPDELTCGESYIADVTDKTAELQNGIIEKYKNVKHGGVLLIESDGVFETIYDRINNLETDSHFPNMLSRNLLISLGIQCTLSRRGDVYFRMDALLGFANQLAGVAEIEFGQGVLGAPRCILDDVATLYLKYNIDPRQTIPLIVMLSFPNIRTEFWRVINDIKGTLGIEINSVSIGALIQLAWNRKNINTITNDFYTDIESYSIRPKVEELLGRGLNVSEGLFGIFEVSK